MSEEKLQADYAALKLWADNGRRADESGKKSLAYLYLQEAIRTSGHILQVETSSSKKNMVQTENIILKEMSKKLKKSATKLSTIDLDSFAETAFTQAMSYDEVNNLTEAKRFYTLASKSYLDLSKRPNPKKTYIKRATLIVNRLEKMAGISPSAPSKPSTKPRAAAPRPNRVVNPSPKPVAKPTGSLNKIDLQILQHGGKINGNFYNFFDKSEVFAGGDGETYSDPMGKLPLSPEQKQHFEGWIRASVFYKKPKMISSVSPFHITQTMVGDCSFICGLTVAANYEMKFRRQLVSSIIYPKDHNGIPAYNRTGKYMVKLWFNGAPRKVLVDDFLPMGSNGALMCSYSATDDLWVSIIEKAYLKVYGGYDFPGSNGGIDLYALTGWIPQNHSNAKMDKVKVWSEMAAGLQRGTALVTLATPRMNPTEEKRMGLVSAHAYALLDCVELRGVRLMKIKNPWKKQSWNGRYSSNHPLMTAELRQKLRYTDEEAQVGVFWIDYGSFCEYFEGIYINWNPDVLKYKIFAHRHWKTYGPSDDSIILAHNPQFRLTVNVMERIRSKPKETFTYGVVWIVLSRHVFSKAQLLSPQKGDFLTLQIFDSRDGELILNADKPLISGIYSNNPHVLCRLRLPVGLTKYTIVVSSFEKSSKAGMNYSLQVSSTENCFPQATLEQIPNRLPVNQVLKSQWKGPTAGGRLNSRTYINNPMFKVEIQARGKFRARLLSHREMYCNVALYGCSSRGEVAVSQIIAQSGKYRHGFCYLEVNDIPAGTYVICTSGFDAGAPGAIILELECTQTFRATNLA